jgi:uncharacterized RDD family membrane protein YckC
MNRTNTLQLTTPEGIRFSLNLAGPVTRFLAFVVDLACIQVTLMAVNVALGILGILSVDLAMGLSILASFIVQIGYGIVLEWFWRGQTIGKKLLRLRVMDEQGLYLHFSQVVIRNLLRVVDQLPSLYLVGGLTALINRKSQRLGDIAARTIVVRSIPVTEPDLQEVLAGKFNSLRDYPHLTARLRQQISPQEADIALQALLRRNTYEPAARLDLFAEIANHLKRIVTFPQEATDGVSDEQYVRNVVDVVFRA